MAKAPKPGRDERRLMRSAARLAAVQALFQMEATGADYRKIQQEFEDHRFGQVIDEDEYREPDVKHFRALLLGAVDRQAEIDQMTDRALKETWPLGRIDPTLRALFRAAGFELLGQPDTPPKVVISEYVDVAKAFQDDGKAPKLVNAVLDHMARAARPEAFG
jgi:N utilization substance protein B